MDCIPSVCSLFGLCFYAKKVTKSSIKVRTHPGVNYRVNYSVKEEQQEKDDADVFLSNLVIIQVGVDDLWKEESIVGSHQNGHHLGRLVFVFLLHVA